MTRREELQDAYEDALFALLMEDVIEANAKHLLEKNEQLQQDPTAALPDALDQRCRKTIQHYSGKIRRREVRQKAGRITYKVFSRAAMVVVICLLLFSVAFAASPTLREKTLNLLIEISDINTILIVDGSPKPQTNYDTSEAAMTIYEQFGYRIPEMPEMFVLENTVISSNFAALWYNNPNGSSVNFSFTKTTGGNYQADTENAQRNENITINGFDGMIIEKDGHLKVVWANTEKDVFVSITGSGVSESMLLDISNAMTS